jgi:hypothetical protein
VKGIRKRVSTYDVTYDVGPFSDIPYSYAALSRTCRLAVCLFFLYCSSM